MPTRWGKRAAPAVAACALLAVLATPSLARTQPSVHVSVVSSSQKDVLEHRLITLKVAPRGGQKLARVFVSALASGKRSSAVVVTRLRDVHLRRHHTTTIHMYLNSAGKHTLAACGKQQLVVSAFPIKKEGGKPGRGVRASRSLKADTTVCKTGSGKGGGSTGGSQPPGTSDTPIAFNTGSDFNRCDFIDPADCLFPFPDDWFTTGDSTTDTKRRVNFNILSMPKNTAGKPIDPSAWNRNDGFSPGEPIVTKVPGLESKAAFDRTGIVPIDDMARAFDRQQPVVVIDAATRARQLIWAEVDSNPKSPADVTLIIRPGKNLLEGHRYIVALRRMRDASGKIIPASASFALYRDAIKTTNTDVE